MRHPLTPDEAEDRPTCPCLASTVRTEGDHVYRTLPNGSEIEILPAPEWDETPFDELQLPNAAGTTVGQGVEQIAEALWRAGIHTVRELREAWADNDWRLFDGATQLPNQPGSNPMFATRVRIESLMRHLERRRAEWEGRKR